MACHLASPLLSNKTQEPNSPLSGRPQRLPCTAASPSSQTSGPSASYSPSLSLKAECPIQVSNAHTHTLVHPEDVNKMCCCDIRRRWITARVISFESVSRRQAVRRMKWSCLVLSVLVVYAAAGGTLTSTHTHTDTLTRACEIRWDHLVRTDQEIEHNSGLWQSVRLAREQRLQCPVLLWQSSTFYIQTRVALFFPNWKYRWDKSLNPELTSLTLTSLLWTE